MNQETGKEVQRSGSGDGGPGRRELAAGQHCGAGAPCKEEGGAEEPGQGPIRVHAHRRPLKFKLNIKGSALTPPAIIARLLKGTGKLRARMMRLVEKGQPKAALAILHHEVLKKAKLAPEDLTVKTYELKESWAGKLATPLQGGLSGICTSYSVYESVFCERDAVNAVAHDVLHQLGLSPAGPPKVAVTTKLKSQLKKAGA